MSLFLGEGQPTSTANNNASSVATSSSPTSTVSGASHSIYGMESGRDLGSLDPFQLDHLYQRFMKSKKQKTKKSVLETLLKSTYVSEGNENQTECIMCQGPFTPGDSIVTLPCKHIFHSDGHKSEECADCPLLVDWLKKNDDCPICRSKLPHEETKDGWRCTLCEKDVREGVASCVDCGLAYRVVALSEDDIGDHLEKLFVEITAYRLNKQQKVGDQLALIAKIDDFMNSSEIAGLMGRGWDVAMGIKMLLDQNLYGAFDFSACDNDIDINSANLIRIWIKRFVSKNKEIFPDDVLMNSYEAPRPMPREIKSSDWRCSLCSTVNGMASDICCNCDASNGAYHQRIAHHLRPIFTLFCDLCVRGFRLTALESNEGFDHSERASMRTVLKRDMTAFLESSGFMQAFENAGFMVKRHLKSFFNQILNHDIHFSFRAECYNDINSVSSYATFIHEIRDAVEKVPTLKSFITIEKPNTNPIQYGENFELFGFEYPAPAHSQAAKILRSNKDAMLIMCKLIAFGGTPLAWSQLDRIFSAIQSTHPIQQAALSMKSGVRDLEVLTQNLSPDTKFFVEAILKKVKQFELQKAFSEVNDILTFDNPRDRATNLMERREGHCLMERQNSIEVDTKAALSQLKTSGISTEEYSVILQFLYKIINNINKDPFKLEFRRITKENKMFKRCVGSHLPCLSLLRFIGFIDSVSDSTRLYLRTIDNELVARCYRALIEFAAQDGISLV